jgi:hypothetical protein
MTRLWGPGCALTPGREEEKGFWEFLVRAPTMNFCTSTLTSSHGDIIAAAELGLGHCLDLGVQGVDADRAHRPSLYSENTMYNWSSAVVLTVLKMKF